jgi:hypothetical protein
VRGVMIVRMVVVAVMLSVLTACNSDDKSEFRSLSKRGELNAHGQHVATSMR